MTKRAEERLKWEKDDLLSACCAIRGEFPVDRNLGRLKQSDKEGVL